MKTLRTWIATTPGVTGIVLTAIFISVQTAVADESPLPTRAAAQVVWVECPSEAQAFGAACGTLPVPLDRKHPHRARINIYFELYAHSNAGPAESAILANVGGPGVGTTPLRDAALSFFAANLDAHDLLLIDDRGRGLSATIDCAELQHGTSPFERAEAACAAQLGNRSSLYGTGDVAMDTEAVRAALGYDKVDYWGGSYGGEDVTAYATRFRQHLRSIVLDAPRGAVGLEAFVSGGNSAGATPRVVRLDCVRSPTCSADHPSPEAEFVNLVHSIRHSPVQGSAHDASGNLVEVSVDEAALAYLAVTPTGNFVSIGELLAAADSLSHGDPAPMLRLGAEVTPLVSDHGDPAGFSNGDQYAAACVDAREPWDWSVPASERKRQFADAVAKLPPNHFAPFSKVAGTSVSVSPEKQCLWWEKSTRSLPVVPPHPNYPRVPTLVMDGDLDATVAMEEAREVAASFPGSTFVRVAEAGHETVNWSQCAASLQSQFIETLHVGDTSRTETPETVFPAVGRFPLMAANARPADVDPTGHNQIGKSERKVVTVAVAAATDALQRSTIGSGNGSGLRAGTFQTDYSDSGQTTTLTDCSFASDVRVNGTVVWGFDRSLVADLEVSGAGTAGGTLHVEGTWQAPGPVGSFNISGMLGGRQVAVVVPAA